MDVARTALTGALLAALVSCSGGSGSGAAPNPPTPTSTATTPSPAAADCPPTTGQGHAAVDYVDFVQAFGRQYVAGLPGGRRARISRADLGRVVLRSRCSLSALNDRTQR